MAEWRRHHESWQKYALFLLGSSASLWLAALKNFVGRLGGTSADMTVTADGTADSVDGGIAGDGFMSTDVAVGIDAKMMPR